MLDMELDMNGGSTDVDSLTIDGDQTSGGSISLVNQKLDFLLIMSSFFPILPSITWDIMFNIKEKESNPKVSAKFLLILCQHPHWSSCRQLSDLITSMMDIISMWEHLKVQSSHVLGGICSLVGSLLLLDAAGKHEKVAYSSRKKLFEELHIKMVKKSTAKQLESQIPDVPLLSVPILAPGAVTGLGLTVQEEYQLIFKPQTEMPDKLNPCTDLVAATIEPQMIVEEQRTEVSTDKAVGIDKQPQMKIAYQRKKNQETRTNIPVEVEISEALQEEKTIEEKNLQTNYKKAEERRKKQQEKRKLEAELASKKKKAPLEKDAVVEKDFIAATEKVADAEKSKEKNAKKRKKNENVEVEKVATKKGATKKQKQATEKVGTEKDADKSNEKYVSQRNKKQNVNVEKQKEKKNGGEKKKSPKKIEKEKKTAEVPTEETVENQNDLNAEADVEKLVAENAPVEEDEDFVSPATKNVAIGDSAKQSSKKVEAKYKKALAGKKEKGNKVVAEKKKVAEERKKPVAVPTEETVVNQNDLNVETDVEKLVAENTPVEEDEDFVSPAIKNVVVGDSAKQSRKKALAGKKEKGKKDVVEKKKAAEKRKKPVELILAQVRKRKASSEPEENVEKKKRKPSPFMRCRTSPSPVYWLVKSLKKKQKDAVKEMGFGALLDLQLRNNHAELVEFLVKNFNYCRRSLSLLGGDMLIGEEDVVSVFNFPRGSARIKECSVHEGDEKYDNLVADFRSRWNLGNGSPLISFMLEGMKNREDAEDNFKRDFIVFVSNCLFRSLQDRFVNLRIMNALHDVSAIKNFNWCRYMIEQLVSSVEEWNESRSNDPWFTGPTAFLTLCYLDRVEFKLRMKERKMPISSTWTSVEVNKRVGNEIKAGGLGKGRVVDCFAEEEANEELKISEKKKCTDKLTIVLGKMSSAVTEFKEVMDGIGKDESTIQELLRKPFELPMGSQEGEKDPSQPLENELSLREIFQLVRSQSPKVISQEKTNDLFRDDDLFADPVRAAEIFAFWDSCSNPIEKKNDISQKKKDVLLKDIGGPAFDLGINLDDDEKSSSDSGEDDTQEAIFMDSVEDTQNSEEIQKEGTPIDEEDFRSILEESEDELVDVLKRRNEPRKFRNLPLQKRSPFWVRKKTKLDHAVSKKEQIMSDFVFSDMGPKEEKKKLFDGCGYTATKADFGTLTTDQWVVNNLVDIWCLKMNKDNMRRGPGEPKCIFFSTLAQFSLELDIQYTTFDETRFFNRLDAELAILGNLSPEDADLVFFAVLQDKHYWAVCINFIEKKVEIIDNRPIAQFVKPEKHYKLLPQKIAVAFFDYLDQMDLKVKCEFEKFAVSVIKMPWRSSENFNDCGIYLMRHMETYKGDPAWDCGFVKNKDSLMINLLRAKYCSAIISMEENELKQEVLKEAKSKTLICKL